MEHPAKTAQRPLLGSDVLPHYKHSSKDVHFASSSSINSKKPPRSSPTLAGRIGQFYSRQWVSETFSCLFALLAVAGLVITLRAHEHKTLPDWPQLVTINSIVSIFSLLIRGGVCYILAEGISQLKWQWFRKPHRLSDMEHFDDASRGTWGSILFICRLSWRKNT
jgi:hypothetical protein